jgi:hypothetical protein
VDCRWRAAIEDVLLACADAQVVTGESTNLVGTAFCANSRKNWLLRALNAVLF